MVKNKYEPIRAQGKFSMLGIHPECAVQGADGAVTQSQAGLAIRMVCILDSVYDGS